MKISSLLFACLFKTVFAASFGEQISDTGIRHSFLITGTKTAIVDEKCEILWEVKAKSRDGEVLPNGNVLVTFANEVKEFTRDYNVVFHYKLAEGNKEISKRLKPKAWSDED